MPYVSDKQRRYMWAKRPTIAKKWKAHTPSDTNSPEPNEKTSGLISLPMVNGLLSKMASGDYGGPPESYRLAADMTETCGTCSFFVNGYCNKYGFPANEQYTCDMFKPAVKFNEGPFAALKDPVGPVGPQGPIQPTTEFNITPNEAAKLNSEQAFKAGFLMRCAEEGLTIDQIHERIQLALAVEKKASLMSPINTALRGAGGLALGLGIGVPLAVGSLGGLAVAKATADIDDSVDALKQRELIETYQQLADEAEARVAEKQRIAPETQLVVMRNSKKEDKNGKLSVQVLPVERQ